MPVSGIVKGNSMIAVIEIPQFVVVEVPHPPAAGNAALGTAARADMAIIDRAATLRDATVRAAYDFPASWQAG
jgi:hypothetical protein